MSASGESLGLSVMHTSVGTREFSVQSDQDINLQIGGYINEIQINGNGTGHDKMKRVPWMLEGLSVEVNQDKKDQEFLQDLSNSPVPGTWTWEHINGSIYTMLGKPQGDMKFNSNSGYFPLVIAGTGIAEPVA